MANVVVAEDELHILRLLGMWLRRNGHEVIEADSGKGALEAVRAHRPQALITDVNMPGMDGLTLVDQVLSGPHPPRVIILLSSRCDLPDLHAKQEGLSILRHPKPFSPSRLLADLEGALRDKVAGQPTPPDC